MEKIHKLKSDLEIRHIPGPIIAELGHILQLDQSWKDVMGLVPGKPWTPGNKIPAKYSGRYTNEDIRLVDAACTRSGLTGFGILVQEWGTSGRCRAKVADLIAVLRLAELERAAAYLERFVEGSTNGNDDNENVLDINFFQGKDFLENCSHTCGNEDNLTLDAQNLTLDAQNFSEMAENSPAGNCQNIGGICVSSGENVQDFSGNAQNSFGNCQKIGRIYRNLNENVRSSDTCSSNSFVDLANGHNSTNQMMSNSSKTFSQAFAVSKTSASFDSGTSGSSREHLISESSNFSEKSDKSSDFSKQWDKSSDFVGKSGSIHFADTVPLLDSEKFNEQEKFSSGNTQKMDNSILEPKNLYLERTSSVLGANTNLCSLESGNVPFIDFQKLKSAISSGIKIGDGAFGTVYKSILKIGCAEKVVAVKILSDSEEITKQYLSKEHVFKTEVEVLSKCQHENIIKLEAFSYTEPELNLRSSGNIESVFESFSLQSLELGLVYPLMRNGSLYDRLLYISDSLPIPWKSRLNIARGTAAGIVYLHTNFNPPLIHRDVKSPNILLDENFVPKLGDFGIVRSGARGISASTIVKTTPIGTQMYMAPEAFRGDVSVKMDTFSFGIVILELLTGLLFFDEDREPRDLLSYVEEYESPVLNLLDKSAGAWDREVGTAFFELVEKTSREKRQRPDMVNVLKIIDGILK